MAHISRYWPWDNIVIMMLPLHWSVIIEFNQLKGFHVEPFMDRFRKCHGKEYNYHFNCLKVVEYNLHCSIKHS